MAEQQPVTEAALLRISGVGRQKAERYGQDFINEILLYRQQQLGKKAKSEGEAHLLTLELLLKGLSPQEISLKQGLVEQTVYSHIAALYEQDRLPDLEQFLSKKEREDIGDALYVHGLHSPLKQLHQSLGGRYAYHKIRLAISYYKKHKLKN